ncbi:MAG: hypothetical protein Q9209_001484 [Squamulea sp. 1 TL-2023]
MRPSRLGPVSRSSASSQKSQKSARYAFDPLDDPRPVPFKFLRTHHLVITTAQRIYTCGSHGITEIFKSGNKGIVAAKQASSGSGILAIADDQLVILHDVRKGLRSSYRLRSADANLIRSWHTASPAACLTLLATSPEDDVQLPIAVLKDRETQNRMYYAAIGSRDSKVFIFDLNGNLLWYQTIFQGGFGIIDVEWMEGDDWPQPIPSQPAQAKSRKSKSKDCRKSLGSVLAGGRLTAEEVVAVADNPGADEESRGFRGAERFNEAKTDTAMQ